MAFCANTRRLECVPCQVLFIQLSSTHADYRLRYSSPPMCGFEYCLEWLLSDLAAARLRRLWQGVGGQVIEKEALLCPPAVAAVT